MRTLAAEGSDIHALADALCSPQPRREEPPRKEQPRPPPREDDWHSMACECHATCERLSEREADFVADMVTWTSFREPTEKQKAWLSSIYRRVRRYG
jgi:hypothetical protein